jgi:hypothetical protein
VNDEVNRDRFFKAESVHTHLDTGTPRLAGSSSPLRTGNMGKTKRKELGLAATFFSSSQFVEKKKKK